MRCPFIKFTRISFLLISLWLYSNLNALAQVRINEVLAQNASLFYDPDFGEFSDIIELHNASDNPVNLKNYSITDNPLEIRKWILPEIVLLTGEHLVLWADGEDKKTGEQAFSIYRNTSIITKSYHLNFQLSSSGEFIGLYNAEEVLVDSIVFGPQLPDVSYGRNKAKPNEWLFYGDPTPGNPNNSYGAPQATFSSEPTFSLPGGYYSESQWLEVSAPNNHSEVRFTTDGSMPNLNSPLYTGPISLFRPLTVKARVYEQGKLPSAIITHTYFINDHIKVPVISISTHSQNLWDFDFGLFQNSIKEREIPAVVEYFDTSGHKGFCELAGVRIFGSTIYNLPQKPLSIRLKSKYGSDQLNYPLFEHRENTNYKSFLLRNGGNDYNLAFMRDGLAVSMVKNKIELDYQDYKPCVVFINGEYWGIYDIRERLDEDYISQNHRVNPNNLDYLEDSLQVVSGSNSDYQNLIRFIETHDLSRPDNYDYVRSKIDINEYLNYMIHKTFIGYKIVDLNNKYWREKESSGQWRWIASDMEHAFGQLGGDKYWENTLEKVLGKTNDLPDWSTYLFKSLMTNHTFRDAFIQRFALYSNTLYNPEITIEIVDSLQRLLSSQMPRHINKWKTPLNVGVWNGNVQLIREFLNKRPAYMRQHLSQQFGITDSCFMQISIAGKGKVLICDVAISDTLHKGHYFANTGLGLTAVADAGYKFVGWQEIDQFHDTLTLYLKGDTTLTALFEPIQQSIVPSLISSDTLLTRQLSPWYVKGDVTILPGARLSLEPGVELLMTDNASIYVHGGLNIEGTITDRIIIKSDPSPGARMPVYNTKPRWGVICITDATDTINIAHAQISGSGYGKNRQKNFATISAFNSHIKITNTEISDNLQPFYSEAGSVYIDHSIFRCEVTCDLINVKYSNNALVQNCNLMGNKASDTDAIDYDGVTEGIIRNNTIYGFWGSNSDGIDLGEGSRDVLIENNLIYDCTDKAISVGQGSTIHARRNLIFDCDMGVAVKDSNSLAELDQNTFYATTHAVAGYEKNTGHGGGVARVKNSILASSRSTSIWADALSEIEINYSISDTEELTGTGNLFANPLFVNPGRGNFELQSLSPCINAGDLNSEPDPDGSRADMGAYYKHNDTTNLSVSMNEINYHSASNFNSGDWIELVNNSDSLVSLRGWIIKTNTQFYEIKEHLTIGPGQYLVICEDSVKFKKLHPQITNVMGNMEFNLNNKTEKIRILNPKKQMVHSLLYEDTWPWPPLADGKGATMELEPGFDDNTPEAWRESHVLMGTPGKPNSIAPTFESIYINELMASNTNSIADEYGEYDDWFEIYNDGDSAVNLGGLYLTGNLSNAKKYQLPLNQPQQTTIGSKGFRLIWADGQTSQGPLHTNFKISSGGEEIGIFQRRVNQFVNIDQIVFGSQTPLKSYGRYPDGTNNLNYIAPTPGFSNHITEVPEYETVEIAVSPNPFNQFTVFDLTSLAKPYNICITDLSGKTVKVVENCLFNEFYLNRDKLKTGFYMYHINSSDGILASGKLIVY